MTDHERREEIMRLRAEIEEWRGKLATALSNLSEAVDQSRAEHLRRELDKDFCQEESG
jgi:predicted  nucleic acid-binding Zn-ribbon protein